RRYLAGDVRCRQVHVQTLEVVLIAPKPRLGRALEVEPGVLERIVLVKEHRAHRARLLEGVVELRHPGEPASMARQNIRVEEHEQTPARERRGEVVGEREAGVLGQDEYAEG